MVFLGKALHSPGPLMPPAPQTWPATGQGGGVVENVGVSGSVLGDTLLVEPLTTIKLKLECITGRFDFLGCEGLNRPGVSSHEPTTPFVADMTGNPGILLAKFEVQEV
jgi:hypothetical protein